VFILLILLIHYKYDIKYIKRKEMKRKKEKKLYISENSSNPGSG
jgi:hypothetical protein